MSDEEFINKLKSELSKNTKENVEEYSENEIDKVNLDSKNIFDSFKDSQTYQKEIRNSVITQLRFKDKWRKRAIWGFIILTIVLLINLLVLVYGFSQKIDVKIIILFMSLTFVHTFTIIYFLFKYIFSSTDELIKHNKNNNA
ncbi:MULTISPECIES: hypothetical protein [Staphylococcus]|nr:MULTISPECIES: hypothetical protein [Staphylococcus]ASE37807.1 hypothetical protein CEP67_11145 [Staphylococcus pettenkoferi]MCY1587629.1 hypothetical protein [Staphylococcus pettenkoferi]MDK7284385.1 hypothetical protein [Staphylococcus pettenkoferi]OFK74575.1 hypothetical protein HMPREF2802_06035 [Staphylococcus sp. HMSC071G07]